MAPNQQVPSLKSLRFKPLRSKSRRRHPPRPLGTFQPALLFCKECSASEDKIPMITAATVTATEAANHHSNTNSTNNTNPNNNKNDVTLVRSTLLVGGICCATEVPLVRRILLNTNNSNNNDPNNASISSSISPGRNGVKNVEISIATRHVYVRHHPDIIHANALAQCLSDDGFPATVVHDGGMDCYGANNNNGTTSTRTATQQQPSAYVESTLLLGSKRQYDETTFQDNDDADNDACSGISKLRGVRAVHRVGKVLKVHHDPTLIQANEFVDVGVDDNAVVVLVDGAVDALYLPETSASSLPSNNTLAATNDAMHATTVSLNVIWSGVFWVVSLTGAIFGIHWMQWMGILSVATGIPPVAMKAYRSLRRHRQLDANGMMVVAACGALILREWDESASVSFLFCVSESLEARATMRAQQALAAIVQLRPEHAHVLLDGSDRDGGDDGSGGESNSTTSTQQLQQQQAKIVPAEQVAVGSLIRVRTGDKVAADGIVVEGSASLDQSSLTGESMPVQVTVGDTVAGGCINVGNTPLVVQTTVTVQDSAVSRLIRLVEEAQSNQSATEKMVDAFARAYTPAVLATATAMATLSWLGGIESGRYWTYNGLILIVIACPCALTISTPVTYAAGLAAAAQKGIICKGGASLEALGSIKTVVLDKTGTLTEGKFAVSAIEVMSSTRSRREVLELLALMEAPSSHPLSATLVQAAQKEGISLPKNASVRDHSILKGEGVTASINDKQVYVGNRRLFERLHMYSKLSQEHRDLAAMWSTRKGGTVGFIAVETEGIVGGFCVTDVVRLEARASVHALQKAGVQVLMLTGDGEGAARAVAEQVGLPEESIHCQFLPEDKLHFVGSLKGPSNKSAGFFRRRTKVLFCGDGVNDAPALAIADIGVSMGEGAALAMEMSDVTLLDSNLLKLVFATNLGSRVLLTIRENILLSLFCKFAVVVLTFGGYMTLLYAIVSDVGVMLLVTINGMKLIPRSNMTEGFDKKVSRFHSWNVYRELPTLNSSNPTGVADIDVELI